MNNVVQEEHGQRKFSVQGCIQFGEVEKTFSSSQNEILEHLSILGLNVHENETLLSYCHIG